MATTKKKTTYRTIGAVSGHLPTPAERAMTESLAEMSVGAQQARDVDAAEMSSGPVDYRGECRACGSHRYGAQCATCAAYAAQPGRYYLDADGEWCAV